ncbi:MAG: hypothetical protein QXK29_04610 [Candidatus Bathyarchaeia archaeon]
MEDPNVKARLALTIWVFLASALINGIYADENSLLNQFLESPLLSLTAIIIIVVTASLYRKIRK